MQGHERVTTLKSFPAKALQPLRPQKAQATVEHQIVFSKAQLKKLSVHLNGHHLTLQCFGIMAALSLLFLFPSLLPTLNPHVPIKIHYYLIYSKS